jgi:signal recognition particle receptor subunit beta
VTTVKMVISGAVNAGKTEFIKSISEIEVVSTERRATDDTKLIKKETTVAMDFGRIAIADDLVLHLFGTPGQKRFDFMWEILSEGMLGLVILVDSTR